MQKENMQYGPFRATRLWEEAVTLFIGGMPLKRHRSHMRQYDNCFTGSEAVKWFHQALERNPHFGTVVTQEKALQLLAKFYEEGIFARVRRNNNGRQDHFKLHGIYQLSHKVSTYTIRSSWSCSSLNGLSESKTNEVIGRAVCENPDYVNIPAPAKRNTPFRDRSAPRNREIGQTGIKPTRPTQLKDGAEAPRAHSQAAKAVHQIARSDFAAKSPSSPRQEDNVWRSVFVKHLQSSLLDLDVSGLLWPSAVIRCRWLDQNVTRGMDPEAQLSAWFNKTVNRLFEALTNWELNHSVKNPSVESDVEGVISYLSGLPSQLVPADLSAIFQRVFLHLEASAVADDTVSSHSFQTTISYSSCEDLRKPGPLPPNTCYETAFTSEEPVTRIVPQTSVDSIHLPAKAPSVSGISCSSLPDNAQLNLMKRNNSAPNILDVNDTRSTKNPRAPFAAASGLNNGRNYATLGCRRERPRPINQVESPACNLTQHSCGKLTVLDRTPPTKAAAALTERQKAYTLRHVRNRSGGYVNMALNDSLRDEDLDLEAAMESLQKLMICSRVGARTPGKGRAAEHSTMSNSLRSFRSDGSLSSYHSAVSSPRRSPSSWKGCDWGWHWGDWKEKLAVKVFRLLLLLLPPQNRACLTQLLKLMRCLPNQCPYTPSSILTLFSGNIMPETEEIAGRRLICFWVRNCDELFVVPAELAADVREQKALKKQKKFEDQKLSTSQQALVELLDQILKDRKMPPKEKQKRLRMFKESYPHIFNMRFPNPDEERSVLKNRPKPILPLGKLRTLRV